MDNRYIDFFDGQVVFPSDLNFIQDNIVSKTGINISSIINDGVFRGEGGELDIVVNETKPNTINVSSGSAFKNGKRIQIFSSDTINYDSSNPSRKDINGKPTPLRTGRLEIDLRDARTQELKNTNYEPYMIGNINYIWIRFLKQKLNESENDTSLRINQFDTEIYDYVVLEDGYEIRLTNSMIAPSNDFLFLGTITGNGITDGIPNALNPDTISTVNKPFVTFKTDLAPELEAELISYFRRGFTDGITGRKTSVIAKEMIDQRSYTISEVDFELDADKTLAQQFISEEGQFSGLQLQIKRNSDIGVGDGIKISIYSDEDEKPSDTPITQATISDEDIDSSYKWYYIPFNYETFDVSDLLWFVIERETTAGDYDIRMSATSSYDNGISLTKVGSGNWESTGSVVFKTTSVIKEEDSYPLFGIVDFVSYPNKFKILGSNPDGNLSFDESVLVDGINITNVISLVEIEDEWFPGIEFDLEDLGSWTNYNELFIYITNDEFGNGVFGYSNDFEDANSIGYVLFKIGIDGFGAVKILQDYREFGIIANQTIKDHSITVNKMLHMLMGDNGEFIFEKQIQALEGISCFGDLDMNGGNIKNVGNESIEFVDGSKIKSSLFKSTGELEDNVIGNEQIQNNIINASEKLLDESLTNDKISNSTITPNKFDDFPANSVFVNSSSVSQSPSPIVIGENETLRRVGSGNLVSGLIESNNIANGAITPEKLSQIGTISSARYYSRNHGVFWTTWENIASLNTPLEPNSQYIIYMEISGVFHPQTSKARDLYIKITSSGLNISTVTYSPDKNVNDRICNTSGSSHVKMPFSMSTIRTFSTPSYSGSATHTATFAGAYSHSGDVIKRVYANVISIKL